MWTKMGIAVMFVGWNRGEPVSITESPVYHPCKTSLGDIGGGPVGRTGQCADLNFQLVVERGSSKDFA